MSGGFLPVNQGLVNIFGRTDFQFDSAFISFLFVLNSRFLDFQTLFFFLFFRFSHFQTPPQLLSDERSDANVTPLPTHPGNKYVARSPCCDVRRTDAVQPDIDIQHGQNINTF